ncbi:MAG: response regulator [Prevotella sp.]|nr:response regulator [Alistipes senegalensis]MCM1358179.1 response regulator [Prevotella sp.]
MPEKKKQKILIVDDCTMNREILIDMLQNEFDIIEATDGLQAIQIIKEYNTSIDLMILDIIMPEADGFEVLAVMNETHIINDVPVIMISAENDDSCIERAYEMGVTDYISRPFNIAVVRRRVTNTLGLHAKHKKLLEIITEQVFEKEKNNSMMINILSHIVESRNGESGMHTLNIFSITNVLLQKLVEKTDKYKLSSRDMSLITTASSLHDIGKIGIPENILNKPARLTPEEFNIMKTHTTIGSSLLDEISVYQDEPLVKIAREICRWHHERYDGKGYPDGLKGEEIPISAQVVSVADVYDALTSERCYKTAFSHEQAFNMIINGECGQFSPLLMECLSESHADIIKELCIHSNEKIQEKRLKSIIDELIQYDESDGIITPLIQIEKDREKLRFFTTKAEELQFDYDRRTSVVIISEWGAKLLGSRRTVLNLGGNDKCILNYKSVKNFAAVLKTLTPQNPETDGSIILDTPEGQMYGTITARTLWENNNSHYTGVIGKISRLKKIET